MSINNRITYRPLEMQRTTMTTEHPTITDLLMRDPEHPDVRRALLQHYEGVCQQYRGLGATKAMLEDVLNLKRAKLDSSESLDNTTRRRVG